MNPQKLLAPIHPGGILHEDFSCCRLGSASTNWRAILNVPPNRIGTIVNGSQSSA